MSNIAHLVITVHGIRTYGQWQARLENILKEQESSIRVFNYKYGYFSIIAFMFPPLRWIITLRFRRRLLNLVRSGTWDRIDLVGHSFGTHLIGWGLYTIPEKQRPKIHTLILSGSVLKSTFRWENLVGSCVSRLVNECGTKDSVLLLTQLMVLFTGMAGRLGFQGMTGESFQNRFYQMGHSDYFIKNGNLNDDFMLTCWVPLLIRNEPIPRIDQREYPTGFRGMIGGLSLWLLNNSEPIKLVVYLTPFIIFSLWTYGLFVNATSSALATQSTLYMQNYRLRERGLLFAAEAAKRKVSSDVRHTIWAGIAQLPEYIQILPMEIWSDRDYGYNIDYTFDENEEYLATDNGLGLIQLWDLENGSNIAHWNRGGSNSPRDKRMHLTSSARCLVYFSYSDPVSLEIWHPLEGMHQTSFIRLPDGYDDILVSSNGEVIAVINKNSIEIRDSCNDEKVSVIKRDNDHSQFVLSGDGEYLAAKRKNHGLTVWNTMQGSIIGEYSTNNHADDAFKEIYSIEFVPGKNQVAVVTASGQIHVFYLGESSEHTVFDTDRIGDVSDIRLNYVNQIAYVDSVDGICRIKVKTSGDEQEIILGSSGFAGVCELSSDAKYAAYNPGNELYIRRLDGMALWDPIVLSGFPETNSSKVFGSLTKNVNLIAVIKPPDRLFIMRLPHSHGYTYSRTDFELAYWHGYKVLWRDGSYHLEVSGKAEIHLSADIIDKLEELTGSYVSNEFIGLSENVRYASIAIGQNTVQVIDIQNMRVLSTLQLDQFGYPTSDVQYPLLSQISNNGKYVAISQENSGAFLLVVDAMTNELLATVTPSMLGMRSTDMLDGISFTEIAEGFGFSSDSKNLLLVSGDVVFSFPLEKDGLINAACRRVKENLSRKESKQFIPSIRYRKTCPSLSIGEDTENHLTFPGY